MTDRKEGSQNSSLRSSYVPPPTNKSGITVGNVEDYESVHRDRRTTINHEALKQDFSKLDKELRLASHWLAKPIECGYLLAFSRTEYNSENVRFLMAMENFKDHMDTDQQAWSSDTWQEIDRRVEIDKETHDADLDDEMLWDKHLDSKLWPSAKIAIDSVSKHVQLIWDNFFSSAASSEICKYSLPLPPSPFPSLTPIMLFVSLTPFPLLSFPSLRHLCQDASPYCVSSSTSSFVRSGSIYRSYH